MLTTVISNNDFQIENLLWTYIQPEKNIENAEKYCSYKQKV